MSLVPLVLLPSELSKEWIMNVYKISAANSFKWKFGCHIYLLASDALICSEKIQIQINVKEIKLFMLKIGLFWGTTVNILTFVRLIRP